MSEEEKPQPDRSQITAEGFLFPEDILQQWVALPADEPLIVGPLTKADLDHLLFSTAKTTAAINALQQSIIDASNGRFDEAQFAMIAASNASIEGETHMRKLFFAVMKSVIQVRKNAAK